MKILFTVIQFPVVGGSSLLIQGLSQRLVELGHETVILTSTQPINYEIKSTKSYVIKRIPFWAYDFLLKSKLSSKEKKIIDFLKWIIKGIERLFIYNINKFAKKHSLPLLWGLFRDPFGWKLLLKLLFSNLRDIDIIYTSPVPHSLVTATLLAGKIKKIPVAITPAYHFSLKDFNMFDDFWARILRKFNAVIPHTYEELNYLYRIGVPKNIQKVIGGGVPFKEISAAGDGNWRNKLNIPVRKFTVLFLNSSIESYYKGIDSVIKSSMLLPSVHFIFVGRFNKDWEALKKKYDLYDVKNISYIEFVSTQEKHQLYNAVDLIVKPSINESLGFVYFEGMCAGKPIITSNIAPMIEVSKDVGLSVPFNSENELINAIIRLKEDRDLYGKCSKNALIKAKNQSWEKRGNEFEKTFRELIKQNRRFRFKKKKRIQK